MPTEHGIQVTRKSKSMLDEAHKEAKEFEIRCKVLAEAWGLEWPRPSSTATTRGPRRFKDCWRDGLYAALLVIASGEELLPDRNPPLEPPKQYRPKEHDVIELVVRPQNFPHMFSLQEVGLENEAAETAPKDQKKMRRSQSEGKPSGQEAINSEQGHSQERHSIPGEKEHSEQGPKKAKLDPDIKPQINQDFKAKLDQLKARIDQEGKAKLEQDSMKAKIEPEVKVERSSPRNLKLHPQAAQELAEIPEAPVLRPSPEEFARGTAYFSGLWRRYGDKHGIVKVIPPVGCGPSPFVISPSQPFEAKVQPLSLLNGEAKQDVAFERRLRLQAFLRGQPLPCDPPPQISASSSSSSSSVSLCNLARAVDSQSADWNGVAKALGFPSSCAPQLEKIHQVYLSSGPSLPAKPPLQKLIRSSKRAKAVTKLEDNLTTCPACNESIVGRPVGEFLKCSFCAGVVHNACLDPQPQPRSGFLDHDWICPSCLEVPDDFLDADFGFEEIKCGSFAMYAKHCCDTACELKRLGVQPTEEGYWGLLLAGCNLQGLSQSIETVYASDVDSSKMRFPGSRTAPESQDLGAGFSGAESGSLLSLLGGSIEGCSTPWLYLGSPLSSFCWHIEDHYLFSASCHYWGPPKVWYGVPGKQADAFETCFKNLCPDLYKSVPDLLQRLNTMVPPWQLHTRGIEVSRAIQWPGEIIVTFPQAYHCGFNTGANCAEAVNFATSDWLPYGAAAEKDYSRAKKDPLFAYDDLVLKFAQHVAARKIIDKSLIEYLCKRLNIMIDRLHANQNSAENSGVEVIKKKKKLSPATGNASVQKQLMVRGKSC